MSKLVIVGSGPGLALSLARRFGREGWQVVMLARNAGRLEAEARALTDQGITAKPVCCDVTDLDALDDVLRRESDNGGIDLLNYNAAVIRLNTSLFDTPIASIQSDITIDLTAALVAARAVIPGMQAHRRGTIIFSGGNLGMDPWPGFLTLGVGKAGLSNCAAALAKAPECAGLRIAYVNIHAHITGPVGEEIADLYHAIHNEPQGPDNWHVHFERPYGMPPEA